MNVLSISDYFYVGGKVLHLEQDAEDGAYLQAMHDSNTTVLTIHSNKFRKDHLGIQLLMSQAIEFGVYVSKENILPMIKIGDIDPYIYTIPFNPVEYKNQSAIDLWAQSRLIVVCFVEGKKEMHFRGIRILGISDLMRVFVIENWIKALEQGEMYSLKYLNFLNRINDSGLTVEQLWKKSVKLGEFEE